MEVPQITIDFNFSILSNISGKFWRLTQIESDRSLREGNFKGGNLLSFLQPQASKISSLLRNPIELSIVIKFSQFVNENSSKFGRHETFGIIIKCSPLSNFKIFIFSNFCIKRE
jgi:5'(3')-deoxyribonucleotidase